MFDDIRGPSGLQLQSLVQKKHADSWSMLLWLLGWSMQEPDEDKASPFCIVARALVRAAEVFAPHVAEASRLRMQWLLFSGVASSCLPTCLPTTSIWAPSWLGLAQYGTTPSQACALLCSRAVSTPYSRGTLWFLSGQALWGRLLLQLQQSGGPHFPRFGVRLCHGSASGWRDVALVR